ncbi:MAG: pentapeptide repeat-containing protein [Candidatus Omnitrophota bacterium]
MSEGARCEHQHCGEGALSFVRKCAAHTDLRRYSEQVREALSQSPATGGLPGRYNFKKAHLEAVDFSGLDVRQSNFNQARLSRCQFVGTNLFDSDFSGSLIDGCDFVGSNLMRVHLAKTIVRNTSFSHSNLRAVNLTEATLENVDLMSTLLYNAILWNADLSGAKHLKKKNFHNPRRPPSDWSGSGLSEKNGLVASESYRSLKHYFDRVGLYDDASWAAYQELSAQRRYFWEKRDLRFIPSFIMDAISGYTEKPNRAISAAAVIILIFAALYYALNLPIRITALGGPAGRCGFFECLYFSSITFTTVGFGDLVPRSQPFFMLLVSLEAFCGPFMAGLFVFTLTRRYAR